MGHSLLFYFAACAGISTAALAMIAISGVAMAVQFRGFMAGFETVEENEPQPVMEAEPVKQPRPPRGKAGFSGFR